MRELLDQRLRELVGRHAFTIDDWTHRVWLPKRLRHNVCLAMDMTVGWGPTAADWESAQTPFLRWFWSWFWQGQCSTCGGVGTLKWVEKHNDDGSYTRFINPLCPDCGGTGAQ